MLLTCVQGDSISFDYSSDDVDEFDDNWTGSWAIVDELGDDKTTYASGSLSINDDADALEMRIAPSDTSEIDAGDYYLVVQITNDTESYNREVEQLPLEITEQGIG
jgi:hypothetical protein